MEDEDPKEEHIEGKDPNATQLKRMTLRGNL